MKKHILVSILLIWSIGLKAQVYVDASATGAETGTSWVNAFTSLQAAIDEAANVGGEEVWVAAGTYYPTSGTDQTISFVMKENVELYGGFMGTETQLSQRDFRANVTTLSGNIGLKGDDSDNSFRVITNDYSSSPLPTSALLVLDGFTITKGRGTANDGGGAMLNSSVSPQIRNCIFVDNKTNLNLTPVNPNNLDAHGGAVMNIEAAPVFTNCTFRNNEARYRGGAVFSYSTAGYPATTFYNCVFNSNHAGTDGGAFMGIQVDLTLVNATIYDNSSANNAGGIGGFGSTADYTIISSILWGNKIVANNQEFSNQLTGVVNWSASKSLIQGGTFGQINTDPKFTDPDNNDLSVTYCSPALDAGDNFIFTVLGITEDINGNPRQVDGTVDIGAIEIQSVPSQFLTLSTTVSDETCNGAEDGEIALIYAGGIAPLEVFVDGVSQGSSTTISSLGAGTYEVMIVDAVGCDISESVTIVGPTLLTYLTPTVTEVSCNGADDGFIQINLQGGTGPFMYSLDGGITTVSSSQFFSLSPGIYSPYVLEANGCTIIGPDIEITEPVAVGADSQVTDVLCNGGSDGEIELTNPTGIAPFEYSIDGGSSFQTSATFGGLLADSYVIQIKDASNCIGVLNATVSEPAELSLTVTVSDVLCKGDASGQLSMSATGGTGSLEFSLDGSTFSSNTTVGNLVSGEYTVVVRDASSCTLSQTVSISEPSMDIFSSIVASDVSCNGQNDGSVSVNTAGGTGPYSFSLDGTNFQSSTLFENLTPNNYALTIMDANGCTSIEEFFINEPAFLTQTAVVTNITCNGDDDGSLSSEVTGGTAPYTYSLDNVTFQSDPLFSGLTPGTYTYYIVDANDCTSEYTTIIEEPAALVLASTVVDVLCNGESTGEISLTTSGGTGHAEYSLDGGDFQASGSFTQLAAGSYEVVVRDMNNCSLQETIVVTEPSAPISTTITATDLSCNGAGDGSFSTSASGGTAPYTFSIDGTNFSSAADFSNLAAGDYTLTTMDANGCTLNTSVQLSEPAVLSATASISQIACNGEADGTLSSTVSGGTAPYMYSLDNSNFQDEVMFGSLAAGSYTYYVVDANGCTTNFTAEIVEPSVLELTVAATDLLCFGEMNGQLEASATGGAGEYEFSIDGTNFSNSGVFSSLSGGSYTVTLRDANGCVVESTLEVAEPDELVTSTTIEHNLCFGDQLGGIVASTTGGTAPYEYSIDGGDTFEDSGDFIGLAAGNYSLLTRDGNGCVVEVAVEVTQPDQLALQVELSNNGVTLVASGGVEPYLYSSDGTNFQEGSTFELVNGDYLFAVRDSNGCEFSSSQSFQVTSAADRGETFAVYPNPTASTLTLSGFNDEVVAEVVNSAGQTVLKKPMRSGQALDVKKLNDGVYYVIVRSSDGVIKSRFIKN